MHYVIGIGSNLGDAAASVRRAMHDVEEGLEAIDVRRSSLYRTSPVGGPEQPDFVNAVLVLESEMEPAAALEVLQGIEQRAGRVRDVRWGPRTLDLDIVAVEDAADHVVSEDPFLTLPHPRARERAFVLIPWHEIEPEASLPGNGSIAALIEAGFDDQDIEVLVEEGT
jgi:2-amino-4-hydroxy-6-hydroxymethyldihydropteridine pyrophosphokinase